MTVNQQSVEDTKQQIRALVNEIAALTKSGAPAEEFFPEFLQRVIAALAAVGGAVWLLDEDQQPRMKYQINVAKSLLEDDSDDATRHNRLVNRVSRASQSLLVPPYSGTADGDAEGNPTQYLLVMVPLQHEGKVDGLIEVFQRPDTPPETQKGYLKFLGNMCDLASEWLSSQKLRIFSDRQVLWQQADSYARICHESLDINETAYVIANEGRRLIGCDRVSVALKKGRKCKVLSISGQDTIENRSNIVASLNQLATRVVAAGEPLWHDGSTEDLPPQIEEALEDYVDQSYGRNIAVLPLREPQRESKQDEGGAAGMIERDGAHRGEVIGALIVEQIESDIPPEVFHARIDLVYEHGTRALANSRSHSNLFLMPLWRMIGKASWVLRARTLPKTLAVVGLILAAILALIFVPMELELEAEGTIEPSVRHNVFAPQDGEVVEVHVGHLAAVEAGQPLVQLKNPELELQLQQAEGELNQTRKKLGNIAQRLTGARKASREDVDQLQGERQIVQEQIKGLEAKLQLLNRKAAALTLRAPITGTVITWDLEQNLINRPVTTGQVLLEVADLTQPMYLELEMPDTRQTLLDEEMLRSQDGLLPVHYILASNPDTTLEGTLSVDAIERRGDADQTEGITITVRVVPEMDQLAEIQPRVGTKVIGDIRCGKRASGFVLFHEPIEWLYKFFF